MKALLIFRREGWTIIILKRDILEGIQREYEKGEKVFTE
jgi:hypothetical protein